MAKKPKQTPKKSRKPAADRPAGAPKGSKGAEDQFCIVGVGASAGGLEAFTALLKALPPDPGMALVFVPHLDPTHESAMTELLSRATRLRVIDVQDGLRVKPNCVYVLPPNTVITITGRVLRLAKRDPGAPHMPVDTFFRSLAQDSGRNAIGVILSGTASDGTLGAAAIKGEGGITFAQDSRTAKYDGMPNSAVAAGSIDFILPPEGIAAELGRIRFHPYVADPQLEVKEEPFADHDGELLQLFRMLKQVSKIDFSEYKPATIRRRILRRMALKQIEDIAEYVKLLQKKPSEVDALYQDILINVTSFFRDPEVFDKLKDSIYPEIVGKRMPGDPVRIWVPGCSTGEEVYSHAMALLEYSAQIRSEISIQIFGTDLSESAIRKARLGIYPDSISAHVSAARLRRFFLKTEGGYQISKAVRDMCVFAIQNVFNDPPFSHIDLVSCRNVLIYLSPALQKRVIPIFHYALNPTGFLMVGNTEGLVGTGAELFELADKKHKIYRKRPVATPVAFGISPRQLDPYRERAEPATPKEPEAMVHTPIELQREADRLLLTKYVPASVLVNERLDVLQTRGGINRYLELPTGRATLNLLKMAKAGLFFELQKALEEVRKTSAAVRKKKVPVERNGGVLAVDLEVIPFQTPLQSQHGYLIVFNESDSAAPAPAAAPPAPASVKTAAAQEQIAQLKQELSATKEYLQSIIEALEASNEELQSANEEIQSGNEELQSTNEELQTSKEELESANEELNTVNEEMQHRNHQLTQLNNDLSNLLASINIPIVMLDADLSVRRYTAPAEELLGLTPTDLGRPIRRVPQKLTLAELEEMMLGVIRDVVPRQRDLEIGETWHRLRVTPYRTVDNKIDGVVVTLMDLGEFKPAKRGKANNEKTVKPN